MKHSDQSVSAMWKALMPGSCSTRRSQRCATGGCPFLDRIIAPLLINFLTSCSRPQRTGAARFASGRRPVDWSCALSWVRVAGE